MKKIFTLLLVVFAVAANAQSIKLFNGETPMNDNDTVYLPVSESGEVNSYFGYQNMTDGEILFRVRKEVVFTDLGIDLSFCIGDCYTGNLSRTLTLAANAMVPASDEMALHTILRGSSGQALVKYSMFRVDNEEDCVSFYIYYGTSAGITDTEVMKVLRAFPNPASKMVNVDYAAPERDAWLVVKNLTGKEVYRAAVSNAGRKQVDVSSFTPGVYLYGVEANGRMLCTKKLLVK